MITAQPLTGQGCQLLAWQKPGNGGYGCGLGCDPRLLPEAGLTSVHMGLPSAEHPPGTEKPGLPSSTAPHPSEGSRLPALQETLQQARNTFNEHLPCHPSTFLENSTTANCIPRHTPCRCRGKTNAAPVRRRLVRFPPAYPGLCVPCAHRRTITNLPASLLSTHSPCCVIRISFQTLSLSACEDARLQKLFAFGKKQLVLQKFNFSYPLVRCPYTSDQVENY